MEHAKPRALFLGSAYAGHRTRFLNLQAHAEADNRIEGTYKQVTGWTDGGNIEKVPFIPRGVKGRLRGVQQSSSLARWPRPDVIWTSALEVASPFMWSQLGPLRRPMVLDLDSTVSQLEVFAPEYHARPPKRGARLAWARLIELIMWRGTSLFTPWSNWAASGLRSLGVPAERIQVLPPGVNLDTWRPSPESKGAGGPFRLLFVGGDFTRKGGDMLLDVFSGYFQSRCELDIVTRDPVEARPGVRVHQAEANSPLLKDLYARADLFVLPTRAECFGIATIEAMATGLPTIVGDVGGARDIVDEGVTGWLIPPATEPLTAALDRAISMGPALRRMGEKARTRAEERFDGKRNDLRIVDLLLDEVARSRR